MIGTFINAGAIVAGGVAGLALGKNISDKTQFRIKLILGVAVIYLGFSTIWKALSTFSFLSVLKIIGIALLAIVLGNVIGKLLRIQKALNKAGQYARERWSGADSQNQKFGEGFMTCTILFCVGPMAIIGAIQDALNNDIKLLAAKSVIDGLASMAFVKTFGWGVILSAIPVLAYQGTITLGAELVEPMLRQPGMLAALNVTGGLLILCTSLIILEVAKVPLGDYLPALVVAPLLAYWWM